LVGTKERKKERKEKSGNRLFRRVEKEGNISKWDPY